MKSWAAVLSLLLVAVAAAWGWHALALDPGELRLRFAGWRVETSVVFGVAALALLWAVSSFALRALFWPRRAWRRRARRRAEERIAAGLIAAVEGRHARAAKWLERAAHFATLRAPALLAQARSAQAWGDTERAEAALDAASVIAPAAALALRARFLLERNENVGALDLLKTEMAKSPLPPAALRGLIQAASRCGDSGAALAGLAALAKTRSLPADAFAELETNTLLAALANAPDAAALGAIWFGLDRAVRRREAVVIAYARRAAALGQALAAMSEIEAGLRREWSEPLARAYGELEPADVAARLRQAESWIAARPDSAGLMLTLGRLCNRDGLWGKARDYLERALAVAPDAPLWEAFGDACAGLGDHDLARRAYRNALRAGRGEAAETLPDMPRGAGGTRASAVERRSEFGVPGLV